jgi:hypothetical protein
MLPKALDAAEDGWGIQCAADTANVLNGGLTYRPFPGTAQLGALRSRGIPFFVHGEFE